MWCGWRRPVALVMTLVLSATTVGLPASCPVVDWLCGVAGRNPGCRCSLRKVLSGTCCCSRGGGCCAAGGGGANLPPVREEPVNDLPPCCAARRKAEQEAAAKAAATEQARSCCRKSPDHTGESGAVPLCESVRGPRMACGCGSDPSDDWLIVSDPRLPAVRVRFTGERPARRRWDVTSERGEFLRAAPEAPPPRRNVIG